jgi:hypothetical protein
MTWIKIDLAEPITFKEDGDWYKILVIKNIKGHVMCEVERFGTTAMRSLDKLPVNVQMTVQHYLPTPVMPSDQLATPSEVKAPKKVVVKKKAAKKR